MSATFSGFALALALAACAAAQPGDEPVRAPKPLPLPPVPEAPPIPNETAPAASTPSSDCAVDLARTIQARYDAVRDFSASFRQQTRSVTLAGASLGADAPSEGSVVFAKPGRMRWQYQTPVPSLVVSDGVILWLYDPSTQEAQRLPVTEGHLTGAALQFLLGEGQLLESFEVSTPSCTPAADGTLELALDPKQDASYESLGLRANLASGEIVSTELVDLFGNRTSISFSNPRTNRDPNPRTFRFEAPDGVQVIDLVPSP